MTGEYAPAARASVMFNWTCCFASLFFSSACAAQTPGQSSTLDPAFENVPFSLWLGEPDQQHFRWTATVPRAELSFHQRLIARVEIKLDGADLQTRRSHGQLAFFVQITGRDGTHYQNHGTVELNQLHKDIKDAYLEYSQSAFILPGDYRLAVAMLDTGTGEHSTIQTQFRVAPPPHDLRQNAWRALPPVEFIGNEKSNDDWYLPDIHGRLRWGSTAHSRVRLNVILNLGPSVPAPGLPAIPSGDLPALIPTLKAISQAASSLLSENVALLDLARRRTVFRQTEARDLDWPRLKTSLREGNTASIDVHSLSERHHDARFFVSEVRKILRASEKPCILVVLTKSVAFEPGEDLQPVPLEGLPACRVFYIRYRASASPFRPHSEEMEEWNRDSPTAAPKILGLPTYDIQFGQAVDQLEDTLKPLGPKVFDVKTPGQIARALADIEKTVIAYDAEASH